MMAAGAPVPIKTRTSTAATDPSETDIPDVAAQPLVSPVDATAESGRGTGSEVERSGKEVEGSLFFNNAREVIATPMDGTVCEVNWGGDDVGEKSAREVQDAATRLHRVGVKMKRRSTTNEPRATWAKRGTAPPPNTNSVLHCFGGLVADFPTTAALVRGGQIGSPSPVVARPKPPDVTAAPSSSQSPNGTVDAWQIEGDIPQLPPDVE
ncbi:unnamed protein product [Lampetra planeri]